MARLGGQALVQPVWIDGLWGSIFSFEGGRFFKKVPKALRYQATVWFGQPISSEAATSQHLQELLSALSGEAFHHRKQVRKTPGLQTPDGQRLSPAAATSAHVNALRLLDTSLLRLGDAVVCLVPPSHVMGHTFGLALPRLREVSVSWSLDKLAASEGQRVVLVGEPAHLAGVKIPNGALVVALHCVHGLVERPAVDADFYPALFDPANGALLTLSVPDPELPEAEAGAQVGRKPGSFGHFLPGLEVGRIEGALVFSKLFPESAINVVLTRAVLDDEGFVFLAPPSMPTAN
ncbi:MAG: hypothetical protein ACOYMN_20435, partial [Roseimicrobium sp.]